MDEHIKICDETSEVAYHTDSYKTAKINDLPIKLFTITFILTVISLGGLGWYTWNSYRHFKNVATKQFRISELSGIITHFEEVLTMSARMAVATGDAKWESRHKRFAPRLDAAIKEVVSLAPKDSMRKAITQTKLANNELVTMENKAMDLVQHGDGSSAMEMLYGQEYEKQKRRYNIGMTKFTAAMPRYVKTELDRYRQQTFIMVALIAVIVPIVIYVWMGVLDMFRKYILERKNTAETLEILNKELEKTVKKLTFANHELQDFVHITAHDLKSPLRAIGTLAGWISIDYADKFDEQGKERLKLLIKRAVRMSEYIDSFLLYSQIGHNANKELAVNLDKLVTSIIKEIAPPENIQINIENELPTIVCEEMSITQIFEGLIHNAVKYMDKPQGQISIECIEQDGAWKFSITDNGPGIDERHFGKIFQMFQTLSPRDELESAGVGLTVVRKIVEMYNGQIWVESKLGEGATFFFTLPTTNLKSMVNASVEDEEADYYN